MFDLLKCAKSFLWGETEPASQDDESWKEGGGSMMIVPPSPLREPDPELVYLGINPMSRDDEAAELLVNVPNVTAITGEETDAMQGKALSTDGHSELTLYEEDGIRRFLEERGVDAPRKGETPELDETPEEAERRMAVLIALFAAGKDEKGKQLGLNVNVADEMAQFIEVLQAVENGERKMDRLVISGHSYGSGFFGEDVTEDNERFATNALPMEHLQIIMDQFPEAQAGVKDLMLSSCHGLEDYHPRRQEPDRDGNFREPDPCNGWGAPQTVDNSKGEVWKTLFTGLETVFGYDGKSPNGWQGSVEDITEWAQTGGDDAGVADLAKRKRREEDSAAKVIDFDDKR